MPVITRAWAPDTCGCVFNFTFDTDGAADQLPGLSSVLKTGKEHGGLTGVTLFNAVVAENLRKNDVFGFAQVADPSIAEEDYLWSFDGSRVLKAQFPKSSVAEKTSLQSAADAKFGPGLVVVS